MLCAKTGPEVAPDLFKQTVQRHGTKCLGFLKLKNYDKLAACNLNLSKWLLRFAKPFWGVAENVKIQESVSMRNYETSKPQPLQSVKVP